MPLAKPKGITNPKLFAVVPKSTTTAPPTPRKRSLIEVKQEKLSEFRVKTKIDKAANALDRLSDQVTAMAKEIAALERRKKTKVARIARIENGVIEAMEKAGLTKADGWNRLFTLRPGPPAVAVDDETLIPAEYMHEEVLRRPEKNVIKSALALGFTITDAAAVPVGFMVAGVPNNTAIKAAIDAGVMLPGIAPLESIPGVRITQKTCLVVK